MRKLGEDMRFIILFPNFLLGFPAFWISGFCCFYPNLKSCLTFSSNPHIL